MNAFIFTEDNNLHITKPNGLRFQFENVDKPNLGFEYDVVIYDKEEFKILNYDDSKSFVTLLMAEHKLFSVKCE